jgi:hypothetical protein
MMARKHENMSDGIKAAWKEVQANNAKLQSCAKHRFGGGVIKTGEEVTCLNCGGKLDLVYFSGYMAGYRAAGRDVDDVWPEYDGKKA